MFFGSKNNEKELERKRQEKRQEKIREEYRNVLREMIIEEIRTPGTHKTRFRVERIGEGYFLKIPKNTMEATNFLNSIIFHRNQIINVSARGDDSLLKDYIVTYWEIDDTDLSIYNSVAAKVDGE